MYSLRQSASNKKKKQESAILSITFKDSVRPRYSLLERMDIVNTIDANEYFQLLKDSHTNFTITKVEEGNPDKNEPLYTVYLLSDFTGESWVAYITAHDDDTLTSEIDKEFD